MKFWLTIIVLTLIAVILLIGLPSDIRQDRQDWIERGIGE